MASKFVRSVKDIYNLENFNTNLVDENDILSTIEGETYIYTKNGFIHLESLDPLKDEMKEVQNKLSDNEEKIKVIETSVEDNKLKVNEVTEKVNSYNLEEMKQKLDAINIDELKQEQQTLNEKIDETNQKIQSNTDKINEITITDTGWKNLKIIDSKLIPHTDQPQYRITTVKGIKTIGLRGAVKGYKGESDAIVGKIPLDGELTNPHYYVQNTSKKSDVINYIRITVKRSGEIIIEGTTYDSPSGNEWCPINTVFLD